jgi:hypothetical protein
LESITENSIIFYADKLISGVEEVLLDERFRSSRRLCLTPEALSSHELQYKQALMVQELINLLGKKL